MDDKWQAKNLTTSLSKALSKSRQLGYSDQAVAGSQSYTGASRLTPVLGPVYKKLQTGEDLHCWKTPSSSGMGPSGMPNWPDVFRSPILGRHLMASAPSAGP